ncbi:hypothetical protein C0J52_10223 [Blattella germanica]|nr:hypothetical protein C0J52_10223 [Blattella germanica]
MGCACVRIEYPKRRFFGRNQEGRDLEKDPKPNDWTKLKEDIEKRDHDWMEMQVLEAWKDEDGGRFLSNSQSKNSLNASGVVQVKSEPIDVAMKIEPQSDSEEETEEIDELKYSSSLQFVDIKEEPCESTDYAEDESEQAEDESAHVKTETVWEEKVYKNDEDQDSSEELIVKNASSNSDSAPNTHTTKASNEGSFKCDMCGKCFTKEQNLKTHKRIHTNGNRYHCEICEKSFSRRAYLNIHKRLHTGVRITCEVCGKTFINKGEYKRHSTIHTGVRFNCDECGKTFTQQRCLRLHMRIHTGDLPFSCEVCHKSFNQKGHLYTHMNIHLGARVSCKLCRKTFAHKGGLSTHMRFHRGDRFSCEVCGKSFTQKGNLTTHRLLHAPEKPYSCDVCGKSFIRKNKMSMHMLLHTGDRFPCELCGTLFTQRGNLNKHMQLHSMSISWLVIYNQSISNTARTTVSMKFAVLISYKQDYSEDGQSYNEISLNSAVLRQDLTAKHSISRVETHVFLETSFTSKIFVTAFTVEAVKFMILLKGILFLKHSFLHFSKLYPLRVHNDHCWCDPFGGMIQYALNMYQ